jgi:hypothetical protein
MAKVLKNENLGPVIGASLPDGITSDMVAGLPVSEGGRGRSAGGVHPWRGPLESMAAPSASGLARLRFTVPKVPDNVVEAEKLNVARENTKKLFAKLASLTRRITVDDATRVYTLRITRAEGMPISVDVYRVNESDVVRRPFKARKKKVANGVGAGTVTGDQSAALAA